MTEFSAEEVAAILAEAGDPAALVGEVLAQVGVELPPAPDVVDAGEPPVTEDEREWVMAMLNRLAPEGAGAVLTGVFRIPEAFTPTILSYLQGAFDPIVTMLRQPANRQIVGERLISVLVELGGTWGWDRDLVAQAVVDAWPKAEDEPSDGDPTSDG